MYLCFSFDQEAGVQLHNVLYEDGLNVRRKGRYFGIQERVKSCRRIGQVFGELSNYPSSCIQHFTDPILMSVTSEEVSVLENGGLEGRKILKMNIQHFSTYHLPDSKWTDVLDSYGDIQHLGRYLPPMVSPFKLGHLHKDCDVPKIHVLYVI